VTDSGSWNSTVRPRDPKDRKYRSVDSKSTVPPKPLASLARDTRY
jgi:hypothetical protein